MLYHNELIQCLKCLGYDKVSERGVCFGLASMAMQAILAGEFSTFYLRLFKISKNNVEALIKKKERFYANPLSLFI